MRRCFALLIALAALLSGCASQERTPSASDAAPVESAPSPVESAPSPAESGSAPANAPGMIQSVAGPYPAPDLTGLPLLNSAQDLAELTPVDFGVMEREYETRYDSYLLLEGTELENTVYVLRGQEDGASIYIVGGIHGDELAGWYAGTLLRRATVKAGAVYILAPANRYGAENDQRRTRDDRDLNRNFPGGANGCEAEQIAASIFDDIADKGPDLVLDLHEGILHADGRDNLGNSIICADIISIGDLVFDLIQTSQEGALTTRPLDIYSSPPSGSLNETVTARLGIPVITAETFREEPLTARVLGQLRLAQHILEWYGLR